MHEKSPNVRKSLDYLCATCLNSIPTSWMQNGRWLVHLLLLLIGSFLAEESIRTCFLLLLCGVLYWNQRIRAERTDSAWKLVLCDCVGSVSIV